MTSINIPGFLFNLHKHWEFHTPELVYIDSFLRKPNLNFKSLRQISSLFLCKSKYCVKDKFRNFTTLIIVFIEIVVIDVPSNYKKHQHNFSINSSMLFQFASMKEFFNNHMSNIYIIFLNVCFW